MGRKILSLFVNHKGTSVWLTTGTQESHNRVAAMRGTRQGNSYSDLTLPGPSHFPTPHWLTANKKPEGIQVLFCRTKKSASPGRKGVRKRWRWAENGFLGVKGRYAYLEIFLWFGNTRILLSCVGKIVIILQTCHIYNMNGLIWGQLCTLNNLQSHVLLAWLHAQCLLFIMPH